MLGSTSETGSERAPRLVLYVLHLFHDCLNQGAVEEAGLYAGLLGLLAASSTTSTKAKTNFCRSRYHSFLPSKNAVGHVSMQPDLNP